MVAKSDKLQKTIRQLIIDQPDDLRLRDHLEVLTRDERFSGLTWFWGPELYRRNRVVFGDLIQNHFSEWTRSLNGWKRVCWQTHGNELQAWLDEARRCRDTRLVRRLLRWKLAAKHWGVDSTRWTASLLGEYRAADTAAARSIVLDEYDEWFELNEESALALYSADALCGSFLLKYLPSSFRGGDGRQLWARLGDAFRDDDEDLYFHLYRKQISLEEWQQDVLTLCNDIDNNDQLNEELSRRHPEGWYLKLADTFIKLLEARGRDVMPYVRKHLKTVSYYGGWLGQKKNPFAELGAKNGWWDLWATALRLSYNPKQYNMAVSGLLSDTGLGDATVCVRLQALAGVSREWNWPGFGMVRVHALEDRLSRQLYERFPDLVRGPFRAHVTPTWWQDYSQLLDSARSAGDDDLVDVLSSRYITRGDLSVCGSLSKEKRKIADTIEALADVYEELREHDPPEFCRRASNVLTQIPAFSIRGYTQLIKTNRLARLLFARSPDSFLEDPRSVRNLVEGSDIHVQMLAYQILAQDSPRACEMAADSLSILLGTLLRPLQRKTRTAAFGALLNASRFDADCAQRVHRRAREALRLADRRYPKEKLIGLIGQLLHECPQLRAEGEQPVVYGLVETAP